MRKKEFGHLTPQQIQRTMVKMGGDIERAGQWLGCSGRTLRRYIHALGLSSILGKSDVPRDRDAWSLEEEQRMVRLMREAIERLGLPEAALRKEASRGPT